MISCSLSPNTQADDVWLAIKVLLAPWKWKRGDAISQVERKLGGVSYNSGRTALLAILGSYGIGKYDEVICQAFTCVAVPDTVRATGARPVFVDINSSYTMDAEDLEKKITKKTRAIIVQHTFGLSADIDRILAIARKHSVKVIEDFAHTWDLPLRGDTGFYSFGRDKVFSSVFGGLALGTDTKKFQKRLPYPTFFWVAQQLFHPIAFALILPTYRIGIGKVLLVVLQRLGILSFPNEKHHTPARYPNALATLLVHQLRKRSSYTKKREEAVTIYGGKGALLRYPLLVDDPKKVIDKAKKHGVLLGNWYHNVIDPTDPGYVMGSCPNAERLASHIVNLPTLVTASDARRIKKLI